MKYIIILAVLTSVAMASALMLIATHTLDSFAQNNSNTTGNQSSSTTANNTSTSNQSESGNISAFNRID